MAQPFLEVAQNEQTNPELIADLNHALVCFRKKRELEEDDLRYAIIADDLFELVRPAEQR